MNAVYSKKQIELLTENERRVYNYLLENKDVINSLKIKDIGEKTYTSSASVMRTAKKLGFKGYKELVYFILNEKEVLKCDLEDRFDVKNPEKIDEFLELFYESKIWIYADGLEKVIAQYMYQKLLLIGRDVEKFNPLHYSRKNITDEIKKDEIIILINRKAQKDISLEIAKYLKDIGVKIVVFTSNKESELFKISDLGIRFVENLKDDTKIYDHNLFYGYTIIFFEKLLKLCFEKKYEIMKKKPE